MFDFFKKLFGFKETPLPPPPKPIQHDEELEKEEHIMEKVDDEKLDNSDENLQIKEQVDEQVEEQVEEQGYVTNMPEHNLEDSDELNGQLNNNDQEEDDKE